MEKASHFTDGTSEKWLCILIPPDYYSNKMTFQTASRKLMSGWEFTNIQHCM